MTLLNIIMTAAIVTVLGVYISTYFLTVRRERIKEFKAINENLLLPYLNDALLFIEMETDILKDNGVQVYIDPNKLISKIQKNIQYGNAELVNALYRYRNFVSYFNGSLEAKSISIYEVFYVYLKYAATIFHKTGYADKTLLSNISKNQRIYGLAFVLTTLFGKNETMKILNQSWLWTESFLDKISIELLEDLITNYNNSSIDEHKLLVFLNILQTNIIEESKDGNEQSLGIKEYINEAIASVKERWLNYSG